MSFPRTNPTAATVPHPPQGGWVGGCPSGDVARIFGDFRLAHFNFNTSATTPLRGRPGAAER